MAKRPSKKPQQLPLPVPLPPATTRVLPMHLRVGDRFSDESGEWELIGPPYTSPGGKTVHARVQRVGQSATATDRSWDAYGRLSVTRASAKGEK